MTGLSQLLAGELPGAGDLHDSLTHLATTVATLEAGALVPPSTAGVDLLVRPFLVRGMLEVGCAMLIGRLDPFRLLAIARAQSRATYDTGTKLGLAIQWSGDILSSEKAPKERWAATMRPSDLTRALLGDYLDELVWQPAFLNFIDHPSVQAISSNAWVDDLRNMDASSIAPRLRSDASRLYSTASKGVHQEFVLSIAKYYDQPTIEELVLGARKLLGVLALLTHFAGCALYCHSADRALALFGEMQL